MRVQVKGRHLWFDVEGQALEDHFTWKDAPEVYWPLLADFVARTAPRAGQASRA
jgi:hypothetical protein